MSTGCYVVVTGGPHKDQLARTAFNWKHVQYYQNLGLSKTAIYCWLQDENLKDIGGWSNGIQIGVEHLELLHVPDNKQNP